MVNTLDTTYTKLFVGGLAWETQRDALRQYFEQFGDILEAVVIYDKYTQKSKGYGFVTFRDEESARKACENPNPVIDGRRANCNLASLGANRHRPETYIVHVEKVNPFPPNRSSYPTPHFQQYYTNPMSYYYPGGHHPVFYYPAQNQNQYPTVVPATVLPPTIELPPMAAAVVKAQQKRAEMASDDAKP